MTPICDIIVAGSYVQDLSFKTDLLPIPGETKIGQFSAGCGGKGFNQAVAAFKQEVTVGFIGHLPTCLNQIFPFPLNLSKTFLNVERPLIKLLLLQELLPLLQQP